MAWLALAVPPAAAQTSRLTMQGPAENAKTAPIRDSLGRSCLDVEAAARAHIVNPQMLDHVVSIQNRCPRLIKVRVCYLGSERCNDVSLEAYKRIDTTLGTTSGVKFFRYNIFQK